MKASTRAPGPGRTWSLRASAAAWLYASTLALRCMSKCMGVDDIQPILASGCARLISCAKATRFLAYSEIDVFDVTVVK